MKVHKSAERELGEEQPSAPLLTNAKHPEWTNLQEGCSLLQFILQDGASLQKLKF